MLIQPRVHQLSVEGGGLAGGVLPTAREVGSGVPSHYQPVPWPVGESLDGEGPERGVLKGRLGFASLLGCLIRRRHTGVLMVRKENIKKMVYLRDGQPIFVRSNILNESLGRHMVTNRLISEAVCNKALEYNRRNGRLLGQVLMDMGEISELNLQVALQSQLVSKLIDLFGWCTGEYRTIHGHYGVDAVALESSTANLMFHGVCEISDVASLIALLYTVRRCHLLVPTIESHEIARAVSPGAWDSLSGSANTEIEALLAERDIDRAMRVRLIVALGLTGHLHLFSSSKLKHTQECPTIWGRGLPGSHEEEGTHEPNSEAFRVQKEPGSEPSTNGPRLAFGELRSSRLGLDGPAAVAVAEQVSVWPSIISEEDIVVPRGLAFEQRSSNNESSVEPDESLPAPFVEKGCLAQEEVNDEQEIDWLPTLHRCSEEQDIHDPSVLSSEQEHTADIDIETLAFERLRERVAALANTNLWERLDLLPGNYQDQELSQAYAAARMRLEQDVQIDGGLSGRCQHLAEASLVMLDEAKQGLMHVDTRDRLGHQQAPPDRPLWLVALETYEAGLCALREGDESSAVARFVEAAQMEPTVIEYRYYELAGRSTIPQPFAHRLRDVSNGCLGEDYYDELADALLASSSSSERGRRSGVLRILSGWLHLN